MIEWALLGAVFGIVAFVAWLLTQGEDQEEEE